MNFTNSYLNSIAPSKASPSVAAHTIYSHPQEKGLPDPPSTFPSSTRPQQSIVNVRFQTLLENLQQYNDIESEEKKILNGKIVELKDQLNQYKACVKTKVEGAKSGDDEKASLSSEDKKQILILQNETKTLKFQIGTMEQDKEILLKESTEFKREIHNLKKEKFDKITEITNLKVELKNLETMITRKLEGKIKSYKRLIRNLKIDNEALLQKNQLLEAKLIESEQVNQELATCNNDLQHKNEYLQQNLIDNLEKLRALTLENGKLKTFTTGSQERLRNIYDSGSDSPPYNKLPIMKSRKTPIESRRNISTYQQHAIGKQHPGLPETFSSPALHEPHSQPIRLHKNQNIPLGAIAHSETSSVASVEKELLSVRIVGKQSMLRQCYFKFSVPKKDLNDTSFLFRKVCLKYCAKYGLSTGSLQFTNYKGDKLSIDDGYQISNGDIIYVNYS